MLVFTLGAFIYNQWSFALPLYMIHLFGDDVGTPLFGFVSSFNGGLVIIFTPILTALLVKFKELHKIMIGMALYSLSFIIIKDDPLRYVFFVMIFVFTMGEIINTLGQSPFMSRRIPASHRGRISSLMGIGYMIGGMGGQLVVGISIDQLGYNKTFDMLVITGAISVAIMAYNIKVDKELFPKLYNIEED